MSVYEQGYWRRWIHAFFPVITLCGLYIFFIPISTIQDNQRFLNVTPSYVWFALLLITLGTTFIVCSITALFKKKAGMVLVSLLAGLILASFLQMLFMDTELGVLNGSYPDWKSDTQRILTNALIWMILLALPIVVSLLKNEWHSLIVSVICLAVLASQIVSVGSVALIGEEDSLNEKTYVLNGKEQYTVSKNENILIFSLDTFSKDIFDVVKSMDKEVMEGLKDFTYYSNTCGTYTTTFPTLVGLLTGEEYLGDVSYRDYFKKAWGSDYTDTFYGSLHKNGYNVHLFIDEYLAEESSDLIGKADNLIQAEKKVRFAFYPRIIRISMYRLLPFCLKEYALITPQGMVMTAELLNKSVDMFPLQEEGEEYESIRKDKTFYEGFLKNGLTLSDSNLFAWTHLVGAHAPYTTSERCESDVNAGPISQATGYLFALEQFFDAMKSAGVYDNSIIVITADHGVDPTINKEYSLFVPILIKMPKENHSELVSNEAPASLNDLVPTLLSFVNSDCQDYGETIFEYNEGEERERILRRFSSLPEYEKNGWTEESKGTYNALETYRFIGNQETLNEMVDNKEYTATPLVDSLY